MPSQIPAIEAAADDPADFSTRVLGVKSPYCGDTGGFWVPIFVSNSRNEDERLGVPFPFGTSAWLEYPGGYYFGSASMAGAWVTGDLTDDVFVGELGEDGGYMQARDQLVKFDKEFARGTLARFYPPASELWGGSSDYFGTVGKPMICIQRGRKLWMMIFVGRPTTPGSKTQPDNTKSSVLNYAMCYSAGGAVGERVLVGDIWEQEDDSPHSTEEHFLNYPGEVGPPIDVTGKKFEAIYENIAIETLVKQFDFSGHYELPVSNPPADPAYPLLIGHLYGVGNDSLLFVDDTTYNTGAGFDTTDIGGDVFDIAWHGTAWAETFIDVTEVVPYLSDRTGTDIDGTDRGLAHVMSTRIFMADAFYGIGVGSIQGGIQSWSATELASHYPTRVARRDAPWCTGRTLNHGSICVGKWIWADDDPDGAELTNTGGRIDPRGGEGFAVVVQESDFAGGPLEVWFQQTNINPSPIIPENLHDLAIQWQRTETLEMRGFDRRTENDCNGAIDCVLWTRGALIANDVFHHQSYLMNHYTLNENRFRSDDPKYCPLFDDYHVTIQDPLLNVDLTDPQQPVYDFLGYTAVKQQPDDAGIWIRRWIKEADRVPQDPDPLLYDPDLDYRIEHHDINDDGWFPIACCLTPYGDFCYVLISAWPVDDWPFSGAVSEPPAIITGTTRTERYFRVIRPGVFDIKTRIPIPLTGTHIDQFDGVTLDAPQIQHIAVLNNAGDYFDNGYETLDWTPKREKNPVKMSCNEHWLYLNNFPASFLGQPPDIDTAGPDYDPTLPIRFATAESNYTRMNCANVPGGDEGSHGDETLTYDWSIDLATGKIVVPWRQEIIEAAEIENPKIDPPDAPWPGVNSYTGAKKPWTGSILAFAFRPIFCGIAYQSNATVTSNGLLLSADIAGFLDRYSRWSATVTTVPEIHSVMLNTSPQFDCCAFVEGYTPIPTHY